MTVTELSRAVSISVPYASQLLAGERNPSLPMAIKIFDATGKQMGALKGLDDAGVAVARQMAERAA